MRDNMGRPVGRIERSLLADQLLQARAELAKSAVPADDPNQGYKLGYQLGATDTITNILGMLAELPESDPKAKEDDKKAWHHGR